MAKSTLDRDVSGIWTVVGRNDLARGVVLATAQIPRRDAPRDDRHVPPSPIPQTLSPFTVSYLQIT